MSEKELKQVMTLEDYEAIKGKIETIEDAFYKGQTVVLAYMADCINQSLVFNGWDAVVRKIEKERCKRMCGVC